MIEIPNYPPEVIQHIETLQKLRLTTTFGYDFEKEITKIFPNKDFFLSYIESELESEFQDSNDDLKFELEAKLKNSALDEIINLTKYEFREHKTLLNGAELQFRKSVLNPAHFEQIPYSATLHSADPNAEVISFSDLSKPVVFFHGGLFSAILMFTKLFIHLIQDTSNEDEKEYYTYFSVKDDEETIKILSLKAIYFYNCYFSKVSNECPNYALKTPFENNILAILLNSISFFIYSHEAGHVLLKHNMTDSEIEDETLWNEEYEADGFAMEHLQNYCEVSGKNVLTLLGPIVFFRYRILLERFVSTVGLETTHPPTIERLMKYITWLESKIHPNDKEILNNFLQFEYKASSILANIFDKIDTVTNNNRKQ
jgi:hypothetical protein